MLIQLSDIISVPEKIEQIPAVLDTPGMEYQGIVYEFLKKPPIVLTITNHGKKRVSVVGEAEYTLAVPCSRCIEQVEVPIKVQIDKELDLSQDAQERIRNLEEAEYLDGFSLDVDRMVLEELLLGFPVKVLCRNSCKGICSVCGRNLNEGTCNCASEPSDPRMAAIQDIFKNFKEV